MHINISTTTLITTTIIVVKIMTIIKIKISNKHGNVDADTINN